MTLGTAALATVDGVTTAANTFQAVIRGSITASYAGDTDDKGSAPRRPCCPPAGFRSGRRRDGQPLDPGSGLRPAGDVHGGGLPPARLGGAIIRDGHLSSRARRAAPARASWRGGRRGRRGDVHDVIAGPGGPTFDHRLLRRRPPRRLRGRHLVGVGRDRGAGRDGDRPRGGAGAGAGSRALTATVTPRRPGGSATPTGMVTFPGGGAGL